MMSTEFIPYLGQNYQELRQKCLQSGKLFEDDQFPAANSSMYKFSKKHNVVWKRASEICDDPKFSIDGIQANDLDQGALGNCWFVASLAAVASIPEYLEKVVPLNQTFDKENYAGIFHFRFWRFGYWIDVVVDDFLPVSENTGRLMFCHNKNTTNEMWSSLVEKAYAKVNLCYEFIDNGGHPQDGLIDLTGGVNETYEIQGKGANIKTAALWSLLIKSTNIKSVMGTSIEAGGKHEEKTSTGLITGHAYTIIGAYEIFSNGKAFDKIRNSSEQTQSDSVKLLKIRNPWGTTEVWNGDYGKDSKKWDKIGSNVKQILQNSNDESEGTFFIPFGLYCKHFHRVHFVHVNLSGLTTENEACDHTDYAWTTKNIEGEFVKGVNSGGCGNGNYENYWMNPQFNLSLSLENKKDDKCSLIVEIMQLDTLKRRLTKAKPEEALAFAVYKIKNADAASKKIEHGKKFTENQLEEVGRIKTYLYQRQVCKRFNLPAGEYVIIPACFDKDVNLKFLLRLFIEGALSDNAKITTLYKHKKVDVVIPETNPEEKEKKIVRRRSFFQLIPETEVNNEENTNEHEGQTEPEVIGNESVVNNNIEQSDLTEEEIENLEAEWLRLEKEWNEMAKINQENNMVVIDKAHFEEEYEDDEDEYEVEESENEEDYENEEEEEDNEDVYGSEEEDERLEEQLREERRKKRLRRQKRRGIKNTLIEKVDNITVNNYHSREENSSRACSVM